MKNKLKRMMAMIIILSLWYIQEVSPKPYLVTFLEYINPLLNKKFINQFVVLAANTSAIYLMTIIEGLFSKVTIEDHFMLNGRR